MQRIQFIQPEEFNVLRSTNPEIEIFELWKNELSEWEKNEITLGPFKYSITEFLVWGDTKVPEQCQAIYYPWQNKVVFTFGRDVFNSLVTVRNKLKITNAEQEELKHKVVGVVGLSVGFQVVKAIVMSNLCGKIRIADFDDVEITNLNRLDSGIFNIQRSKTEIAYRWIVEQNPFINVEVFDRGVSNENLTDFIKGFNQKLDVLIDECDNLLIKVLLRKEALKSSIPVIMHTSDRGMLDVENFSISTEPFEFSFLKYASFSDAEILENAPHIIADICDLKAASENSKMSFMQIGKTLRSWPQLAEDVVSGGGNVATAVRLLLLGKKLKSQRIQMSPEIYLDIEN